MARRTVYVSTPNVLTLAPEGAERRTTPGTCKSTAPRSSRELCASCFDDVELLGLFHARKLRAHELALKRAGTPCTRALGITKPFYDRFTPGDLRARLRAARPGRSTARWTSSRCSVEAPAYPPELPDGRAGRAGAAWFGFAAMAAGSGAVIAARRSRCCRWRCPPPWRAALGALALLLLIVVQDAGYMGAAVGFASCAAGGRGRGTSACGRRPSAHAS